MKPGRKPSKNPKSEWLPRVRCTLQELNRVKGLAKLYAGGDVSKWMRHAAVNGPRRHLK